MAKGSCERHPDVSWFTYTEPPLPCFLCEPEAWPPLQEVDRNETLIADLMAEQHRPPGIHGSPVDWEDPLP